MGYGYWRKETNESEADGTSLDKLGRAWRGIVRRMETNFLVWRTRRQLVWNDGGAWLAMWGNLYKPGKDEVWSGAGQTTVKRKDKDLIGGMNSVTAVWTSR